MNQIRPIFALSLLGLFTSSSGLAQYSCEGSQDKVEGSNFNFVRCYADPKDKSSRMIAMTVDSNKFPSAVTLQTKTSFLEQQKRNSRSNTFLMNGPMFRSDGNPVGLIVNDGNLLGSLNPADKDPSGQGGNFFSVNSAGFENNGVIILKKDGTTQFLTRSEAEVVFKNSNVVRDIQMAFQGGPILVKNGKINDALNPSSPNIKQRSAVCITKAGKLRFMTTNYVPPPDVNGTQADGGMSFYGFANAGLTSKCIEKDGVRDPCVNSLFVDGSRGVVDSDFEAGGLNSDSDAQKNVFVVKLTR